MCKKNCLYRQQRKYRYELAKITKIIQIFMSDLGTGSPGSRCGSRWAKMIQVPIRIQNTASQVTNIRPKLPVYDNNFSPDPKLWGSPKLLRKKYALCNVHICSLQATGAQETVREFEFWYRRSYEKRNEGKEGEMAGSSYLNQLV